MSRSEKYVGYAIAIAACVAILLSRLALSETLGGHAQFLPFILAILAAAWWGGRGPGITATLLSALLAAFFIVPPVNSIRIGILADGVALAMFVVIGLTVSYLCHALHQAHRREFERQFHTLADSVAQLVWMAGPDGERFWFNQRWRDYSGATLEQLSPGGWQSFCEPADLERVLKSWQSALAAGEPWEETYPLRRKDGQMRWHLSRATPVRDRSGQVTRWFGTSTDIHDRVLMEQALEEADTRKNQFLASLAHELRNPLWAISTALQFWKRVAGDATEVENLRTVISRQVQQLVRLVDDLLDVARITSGKIKLRCARIDLCDVIARAVETVQPLIDAAGHRLVVNVLDEAIYVNGDKARLTQVLSNILNNAAKYTPRQGLICVIAERQNDQALVRIRDNGAGIPTPMLTAIFDPFCQVEQTTERSQGGLGIGLTLSKQLVELHGGTIAAHSDGPGTGSEFTIALPVLAAPALGERVPSPPNRDRAALPMRILVVDDLRESADLLANLLRSMGHEATSLYDGETAFEWIVANRPNVAFVDIAMPGIDGYEVARRVRERQEMDATVLVALTGFGQLEDGRRACEASFDFHVTKPADLGDVEELLLKLQPVTEAAVSCTSEDIEFTNDNEVLSA